MRTLAEMKADVARVRTLHSQAIFNLMDSGIFDYLMYLGAANPLDTSNQSFKDVVPVEYGRAIGYRQCLLDLINFMQLLSEDRKEDGPSIYSQAIELAFKHKKLTKEEYDVLKSDPSKSPDYRRYTEPTVQPTSGQAPNTKPS